MLLEKLNQLNGPYIGFESVFVALDWYLFQLMVLLKPDVNCCISFSLYSVNKVTTGT